MSFKKVAIGILFPLIVAGCSSKDAPDDSNNKGRLIKGSGAGSVEVTYTAPEGWIAEPPASSMRKAQYRWPGAEGAADAEMAVFFFPGTGGSTQQNLNRWYGQFKQPDGSDTKDLAEVRTEKVGDLDVTVVYVTGTYLQPKSPMMMSGPVDEMDNYAMLAAVAETPNGPWFFKATGPKVTIDSWRESFGSFVKTFSLKS